MAELKIKIHNLTLKNPVTTASGTFGFGEEFEGFMDPGRLGGIFVKGLTLVNREGNAYPRMAETPAGMLNSVGLQNKGVDYFIENILPRIRKYGTEIIPNINGGSIDEYVEVAGRLKEVPGINAVELNISCPNVKEGGMEFGINTKSAYAATKAVREVFPGTLIVKLSPNVTSIVDIAKAVRDGGADSLSLINTLLGMAIDASRRKPVLSRIVGGLSGPAIKPVALRMVWQVHQAVDLPIFGIGGIMNATDAVEFMLAGASAVQVGTANFMDPLVSVKIVEGINEYLDKNGYKSASEIVGALET